MEEVDILFREWISTQDLPFYFTIKVTPSAQKTMFSGLLEGEGENVWKMKVQALPEKGKANKEIVRWFVKEWGLTVEIISGQTDKVKLCKVVRTKKV